MTKEHNYKLTTVWTGNTGSGTKNVRSYDRSHTVAIQGKPELFLTTDNPAVGDKSKLNPEDLLVTELKFLSSHLLSLFFSGEPPNKFQKICGLRNFYKDWEMWTFWTKRGKKYLGHCDV